MTGKTNIAKALSSLTGIPYYKNKGDASAFAENATREEFILGMSKWADPYLVDFLQQTGHSAILDRNYPSEWVYSRCFNRKTDDNLTMALDTGFSTLNATIILCRRKSYAGISDDIFPDAIKQEQLEKLDSLYEEFSKLTQCRVVTLWTDQFSNTNTPWDIQEQLKTLVSSLGEQH